MAVATLSYDNQVELAGRLSQHTRPRSPLLRYFSHDTLRRSHNYE